MKWMHDEKKERKIQEFICNLCHYFCFWVGRKEKKIRQNFRGKKKKKKREKKVILNFVFNNLSINFF